MDNTQQQRENHTNSLSEEHVQGAIETVLANPTQTYEEFINAFMVLTPEDIASFKVPEENMGEFMQDAAASLSEVFGQLRGPSSEMESQLKSHSIKQQNKGEEELEIEELGEDTVRSEDVQPSGGRPRASKYIKVDNYIDEPDSESEVISDDEGAPLEFDDDSSSNYVASFDTEKEVDEGVAKSTSPVRVTQEMIKTANDESDLDTSKEEYSEVAVSPQPFTGPFPGEVDEEETSPPHPGVSSSNQHVTQLPHSTRLPQPADIPLVEDRSKDDAVVTHDEVEAFSIDPDFDYDNVILTPKWAPGEGPPIGT